MESRWSDREASAALRRWGGAHGEAFAHAMTALERAARATAARQGLILDQSAATRALLWSTVVGVANMNVAGVERVVQYHPRDLIERAARMIVQGLIEGS